MKSYSEFITENFRKEKLVDFLDKTFSNEDYYFINEKLHFVVRKNNLGIAIPFFKTIERRFRYYISYIDGSESDDVEDYNNFRKNLIYNLTEMAKDIEELEDDDEMITLIFEPILGESFVNVPDIVYHVTDVSNISNIKKKGIIPKNYNKISYHPKRIYLLPYMQDIRGLISHPDFDVENPILLTIDISKHRDEYNFYQDINYYNGFFVTKPIPPQLIIDYMDVNSNYRKIFK